MNADRLQQTVIDQGYCIGCGACAAAVNSPFTMGYDRYGRLQARLQARLQGEDRSDSPFEKICPFGAGADDEDSLAAEFLPDAPQRHAATGRFISCRVGHVEDAALRAAASSGGMGRWLSAQLLRRGLVDAVIHVAPGTGAGELFAYSVSEKPEQLTHTARSAYYPVSLDAVITHMREHPGRYAITGVPCFVKALRLLSLRDPEIRQRISFTIGIICGHLKSTAFAEAFGWQLGVPPDDLGGIEFRGKLAGQPANHKGVSALSIRGGDWSPMVSSKKLLGGDWGLGFFKYQACDYCDDITAETADIAIGDAWLPEFVKDSNGTSVIVCRNPVIEALLEEGRESGALQLLDSTPEQIARSQAGGLRHRREGLAYRLALADARGRWHPPKRTQPSDRLSARRKRIYELRVELAARSHEAFLAAREAGDFDLFGRSMRSLIRRYERAQSSWHKFALKRANTVLKASGRRLKGLFRG